MNRNHWLWVALCVLALAIGCGGEKKDGAQSGGTSGRGEDRAAAGDSIRKDAAPRRFPKIQGALLDSLQAKKERFRITYDEYWEDRGGVLGNEYFEVWYPAGEVTVTHGMYILEELMPARRTLEEFFGEAPRELLVIKTPPDLDVYKRDTGREWWYYSELKGDTMTFAPVWILSKRGISAVALPHEYFQWAIRKITRNGAPRWMEEGIASYLSGEGDLLLNQMYEFANGDVAMTPEEIEGVLQGEVERRDSRIAYYHSFRMVKQMIETYGEDRFKKALWLVRDGKSLDEAFGEAVGKDYAAALADATKYTVDLTRKQQP